MLTMDFIQKVFVQYGLPTALVIYFIWRDHIREAKMSKRIEMLEGEIRNILTDLVAKTTAIIVANSEAMKDWLTVLRDRPCIADALARKLMEKIYKEECIKRASEEEKQLQ